MSQVLVLTLQYRIFPKTFPIPLNWHWNFYTFFPLWKEINSSLQLRMAKGQNLFEKSQVWFYAILLLLMEVLTVLSEYIVLVADILCALGKFFLIL